MLSCNPARTNTLTQYVDLKALKHLAVDSTSLSTVGPLQSEKCATDRVYNKSTETVWHFIYSCTVNPMKLSLIPYIDLTQPLWGEIRHCSVMGTCVYTGCGYTVFVVQCWVILGWASVGWAACPRAGCTEETSRLCLHLSTSPPLPAHSQWDLMGLSCPRSPRLYRPRWDNNSASITSAALIEILYLLNLHYCWRVAEFLGPCNSFWQLMNLVWADTCTRPQRIILCIKILVWQVQRCMTLFLIFLSMSDDLKLCSVCWYKQINLCNLCSRVKCPVTGIIRLCKETVSLLGKWGLAVSMPANSS